MKQILKITALLLLTLNFGLLTIKAQTPNQFKYQAVLRNASGTIMADEAVAVNISILQGSATGTSVFTETHNVTTTAQGLINLNIGSVEDLSVVDFSANTYFVEISVNGTVMGTSQLLSVPYAMQAKTAETVDYANVTNMPIIPEDLSDLTDNSNLLFDGDYNNLSNLPTLFDGDYNSLANLPTLFDGNYNSLTNLPTLFDGNWSSLTGTTPNVSTFTNDAGYLTSYTETDPIYSAWDKSTGISITESQISDFKTYLTSYTETDPVYSTNFDLASVANGDLLQYNGTKFVKFTPNYLTTEVDGDITNEIQDLNLSSNNLTITNNSSATTIDLSPYLDDQTVAFTNGTGINVTGTYPDFTVTNTAPDQTITITAGNGITVTGTYPDFTVAKTTEHYLGEEYLDGIIYYLYTGSDGQQHGLVVSKTETTAKWQNTGVTTNATRSWDGSYNMNLMTDSPAKTWVQSLGAGWYLPSIDELSLLWHSRFHVNNALNTGGYTLLLNSALYWSSLEYGASYAYSFAFDLGYAYNTNKSGTYRVRAVRAF